MFIFVNHADLIFMAEKRWGVSFFGMLPSSSPSLFIKHCRFPTECMFSIFVKISWLYLCRCISESILSLAHIFIFKPELCYFGFYSFVWHFKVKVCEILTLVILLQNHFNYLVTCAVLYLVLITFSVMNTVLF